MPQFSANLSMLFPERPFLQRFAAAAQAGFSAVEFMFPYAFTIADLRDAIAHSKVRVVLHNLPPGDWDAGDRGIACHPNRTEEFRDSVAQAIAYASALQVPRLNCLAGCTPADTDPVLVRHTLVANLRFAAEALLQYDIYHMQRMEGELATTLQRLLPHIGHIQIADTPGRHEPGTGEINYPFVLRHLDAIGYQGWVGCEYLPLGDTQAGLVWLKNFLQSN